MGMAPFFPWYRPGSLVRSTFCPQARSVYQGYIAWRGLLEEQHTPSHILSFLGSRFTVYSGPDFHILAYLIPGSKGEVEKGCRRVNWVWYWNTKPDNLDDILTDVHGHRHGFSLPRGLLRPEVAEVTRKLANEVLPSVLADMVGATPDIFVQAIHDMLSPHLAFHGRVALLGDAGCILRPHTAAGTTKAAVNAWALASCLEACGFDVQRALEEYEAAMLPLAKRLVEVGVAIGTRSQFPQKVARAGETNDSGIALE